MRGRIFITSSGGDVQSHQSLARAWYTGHKADELLPRAAGFVDQLFNAPRCNVKILSSCIETRDGCNGMLCVKGSGAVRLS